MYFCFGINQLVFSMAKTVNKDILQSYIVTTAKYDFSAYEKRVLYRIIEMNQCLLEGKKLNEKYRVDSNLFGDRTLTIPISAFLKDEKDNNYTQVKKALESLKRKEINYEDDKVWASLSIIANPIIDKYGSSVTFHINHMIYDALLDFSKGFRKYELQTAMQFESVYAMRFYEIMSGQRTPIEFKIETLKEMFGISNKYKRVNDFLRYVLDIAKKELDEKSPYSFDYEPKKIGRAYHSILFFPKYNPKNRDSQLEKKALQKQVSLSWDLPKNVVDYLKHNFDFTTDGVKNNIELFKQANEEMDLIPFLASLKGKIRASKNPQGYVIGAIKKQLYF